MAKYTVRTSIAHDLHGGPSRLKIKAKGDKNILKDIENYALNYEHYLKIRKELDALWEELRMLRAAQKEVMPMG